jgi:uncharacterized protein (DUF1810 family)
VDNGDPFDLRRFVEAQSGGVFEQALAELRAGHKRSHWMWFVFPQHRDLGQSPMSKYYGLAGVDEARAYIAHPLLGPRLLVAAGAISKHLDAGDRADSIMGLVDALKLRSSMDIFARAAPDEPLFGKVLKRLG